MRKAALAAKRRRRTRDGKPWSSIKARGARNLTRKATKLGAQHAAEAQRQAKLNAYTDVLPMIQDLRDRSQLRVDRAVPQ
jgi:hypothetical protein